VNPVATITTTPSATFSGYGGSVVRPRIAASLPDRLLLDHHVIVPIRSRVAHVASGGIPAQRVSSAFPRRWEPKPPAP
jgi:hypothetical protein